MGIENDNKEITPMKKLDSKLVLLALITAILGFQILMPAPQATVTAQADESKAKPGVLPVETNMHEFMEYYHQPTYRRLKVAMASEPTDKAGWKAIKSDSLILAEGSNLLLSRVPEKDGDDWIAHSNATRGLGAELYAAARKRDYPTARAKYESMLKNCNACHIQFEKGKHILKP